MTTRVAEPGSPLRQERYASSPLFERGLAANLVARRCTIIDPPADRAPLWFVQYRSWAPGGLEMLAREILSAYQLDDFGDLEVYCSINEHCGDVPGLQQALAKQCLDPKFRRGLLWDVLDDYRRKWIAARVKAVTITEIVERVSRAMRYAREAQTMVLIDGRSRLGKTFSARAFCEQTGGLMRYVEVPSRTDTACFARAIADALGMATNLNLKVQVLWERIRDTLASGDISLCLDEAHFLWPQGRVRSAFPDRVNFVMTELCNQGIPVVLVTTPQFYTAQAQLERQTAWTSEQFIGRLGHTERLPETLTDADLRKVATVLLPQATERTIAALVAYAVVSKKGLASIEAIAKRATWLAREDGRDIATEADVKCAMKESVIPADTALAEALTEAKKPTPRGRRGGFAPNAPPRSGMPAPNLTRSMAPAKETVET